MSDLRTEIVSKVLNSWERPMAEPFTMAPIPEELTIAENIFNFIHAHPSCTSNDVVDNTNVDLGRASATLLALYQKGKVDRKKYPNPNPDGKRDNVYVYWATVDKYSDKGVHRLIGKAKKPKKVKLTQAKSIEQDILEPIYQPTRMRQFAQPEFTPEPMPFDADAFVATLNVHDAKKIYNLLKGYFA
jgi:hypothetical protein